MTKKTVYLQNVCKSTHSSVHRVDASMDRFWPVLLLFFFRFDSEWIDEECVGFSVMFYLFFSYYVGIFILWTLFPCSTKALKLYIERKSYISTVLWNFESSVLRFIQRSREKPIEPWKIRKQLRLVKYC